MFAKLCAWFGANADRSISRSLEQSVKPEVRRNGSVRTSLRFMTESQITNWFPKRNQKGEIFEIYCLYFCKSGWLKAYVLLEIGLSPNEYHRYKNGDHCSLVVKIDDVQLLRKK